MKKILIVGGVAGGATTAARLRRRNEKAKIVIFERGKYISYANCGLPYYIGGTITERDKLFVQTPEGFSQRFNLDVRVRNEVLAIDREKKRVKVKNLDTQEIYTETYDTLVLSPGAEPVKPPIPGINSKTIFTLRNVPDTDRIKEFIETAKPRRAVIVGAGFIGLEMAENLHRQGIFVTIVEMAEQVMTPLDYEMAAAVHQHLRTKNVEFYLNDAVSSFAQENGKLSVRLQSGRELSTDLVILSIGVKPESRLAREAGLETGETGGITVNKHLQTSDPHIYAVGDAIEFKNPIIKKQMIAYLAGPSNKQGRIAADNIIDGNEHTYPGTIATAIAKVFDLTVASTGVSEKALRQHDIPYIASIIHASSHAGYYPDAQPMTIKIQFSPKKGRLLGAQIVGSEGVDKRIDLLAAIIKQGGSIYDLEDLEHAYAPPFSSAKDPVNQAGFAAENILQGLVHIVHWYDIVERDSDRDVLVDVRTPQEVELGTIEGSLLIPLDELRDRLEEIPKEKRVIIYCAAGLRGYLAARILKQNGFEKVFNLSGGYKTFVHATQKQSNEDIYDRIYIHKDDVIYSADPELTAKHSQELPMLELDASGLQCPGPIVRLREALTTAQAYQRIRMTATDPGFRHDVQAWCHMTGNRLLSLEEKDERFIAVVQKSPISEARKSFDQRNFTQIVFSDEPDKALATLMLANSAASSGKNVTLFFTFWGLNLLKKTFKPHFQGGRDWSSMKWLQDQQNGKEQLQRLGFDEAVAADKKEQNPLQIMLQTALKNKVRFVACQMSMDMLGIDRSELIDDIEISGMAAYLDMADQAHVNLFV